MNQFIATHGEDTLREENKKLKEEVEWKKIDLQKEVNRNKELKELLIIREEGFEKVLKVRTNMAKGEIEFLEKENKKLKEEIKKLKEDLEMSQRIHMKVIRQRHPDHILLKENKELKASVELKKDAWCPELILKDLYENTNYKDPSLTIKDYIVKVEEENKKLKRANEINSELHSTYEECIGKAEEEIKKLTGQLKEARDEITREYDGRCADNDENDAREEKLKEENEHLTDICEELNSIIPKCDGIDDIVCSVQFLILSQ